MEQVELDLQKLVFFTEGNTFTGSKTMDRETGTLLRYRVAPNREEGALIAHCWTKDVCFELAEDPEQLEAPLNEDGLVRVRAWLTEQYLALRGGKEG